jgi:hypothetical protein
MVETSLEFCGSAERHESILQIRGGVLKFPRTLYCFPFKLGCILTELVLAQEKGSILFCGVIPHRCILVLHGSENVIEKLSNGF